MLLRLRDQPSLAWGVVAFGEQFIERDPQGPGRQPQRGCRHTPAADLVGLDRLLLNAQGFGQLSLRDVARLAQLDHVRMPRLTKTRAPRR